MPASFATSTPAQETELRSFLLRIFGISQTPPTLQPLGVAWKFFAPHPWWPEGRSYVLRTEDGIAAHACVSPVRYATPTGDVESMQIIDWAAGRTVPAAGLLMYRRCLEIGRGTLLTVGGSADTLKLIPQVKWFKRRDNLRHFARSLHAWRRFSLSARRPRDLASLGRNLWWQLSPALPGPATWRCRPALPGEAIFSPTGEFVPISRTRAWFDYLLACPLVPMQLLILEQNGQPQGHALLADALGSMRVADFVLAGLSPSDHVAAFSALVRHIAAQGAVEIAAASSRPDLHDVFLACGLRHRGDSPVYLADPRHLLPTEQPLEINLLIGDGFYLYDQAYPFLC